jgi:tol-pal system protein YbgF
MKLRALLLAGLCVAGQAHAGLFSDDEAREQIQQVEARVSKLEATGKQQADANKQQADTNRQQAEISKQQTRSLLDLQTQIETQNAELRRLRGQNEEFVHGLQDAEKRQKDFYIDLDTRLRHFESVEAAALTAPPPPPPDKAVDAPEADSPAMENRAYEAAHKLFKAGNHQKAIEAFQQFLKKFPESVHVPNVHYEMGSTFFALKDYKNALTSYQLLMSKYSFSPKTPDAMLSVAECQQELNDAISAKKTLKQIIAKYPGSRMADEARKRLATLK